MVNRDKPIWIKEELGKRGIELQEGDKFFAEAVGGICRITVERRDNTVEIIEVR